MVISGRTFVGAVHFTIIPEAETVAVTFVGAAGMLYCSADVAAGAIAIVVTIRANAPSIENFFFI